MDGPFVPLENHFPFHSLVHQLSGCATTPFIILSKYINFKCVHPGKRTLYSSVKIESDQRKGRVCPSEKYSTIYLINNKIFVSQTSPCWDLNIKELRTRDSFHVLGSDYGWEKGWFRHSFRNGTVISVFTKHVCRIICKCFGRSSVRK